MAESLTTTPTAPAPAPAPPDWYARHPRAAHVNPPDVAASLFEANRRLAYFVARRFERRISRELRARLGGPDATDQQALIALWDSCQVFDPSRGVTIATYAYRCIANRLGRFALAETAGDKIDGRAVEPLDPAELRDVADRGPCEARPGPTPAELAALRAALGRLTERRRRAVELVFLQGMTQKAAASVMGVTGPCVGKLQWRGLDDLRRILRDGGEPTGWNRGRRKVAS